MRQDSVENEQINQDLSAQGVSIENASYIENNLDVENKLDNSVAEEDYAPKLFSEDTNQKNNEEEDLSNKGLFDQNSTDDEDFEIPAFLRKQKF